VDQLQNFLDLAALAPAEKDARHFRTWQRVSVQLQREVRSLQRALGFPLELTAPFAEAPATALSRVASKGTHPVARSGSTAPRLSGTVKFFDAKRGYGFLTIAGGAEVYVHESRVEGRRSGQRALRKGQRVDFELGAGRAGEEARNVTVAREMAS